MKSLQYFLYQLFIGTGLLLGLPATTQAQTIVPTQTDEIIVNPNMNGKADPGDQIRYKVTIQNTAGPAGTGVQLNVVPDPRTTFSAGTFLSSPLAVPDAYTCTGNVPIFVVAPGIKGNDFDDGAPGSLSISPAMNQATLRGGSVDIFADGSFEYTPPAGYEGDDSFTYMLNDATPAGSGAPITDVGMVTVTISGMIWFINNSAAAGDGRLSSPFNSLGAFNAANGGMTLNNGDVVNPEVNETIFLYTGAGNYTSGIALLNGQRLFGQGASTANLATLTGITFASNSLALPTAGGMRPVIVNSGGDGVGITQNNTLRGFNVGACSDFGIETINSMIAMNNLTIRDLTINNTTGGGFRSATTGGTMDVIMDAVSSTGGLNGIYMIHCGGTFTVNGGTITNPSSTCVRLEGGSGGLNTVNFTYSGNITTNTTYAVFIGQHETGAVLFQTGTISSTGQGLIVENSNSGSVTFNNPSINFNLSGSAGIVLFNNAGGIMNFGGTITVSTLSTSQAFQATGGGTVNATGSGSTLNSVSATALRVENTTIGAGNLNFQSISSGNNTAAADPANGIVLNTTGSMGGLTVTGIGTTNGSGGTIQNITARGASFTSAAMINLSNMQFTNANLADGGNSDSQLGPITCGAIDNSACNAAIYLSTVIGVVLTNIDISGTTTNQGINAREVVNFQLLNSTITQAGTGGQGEEGGVYALNLSGNCAITNTTIDFSGGRNVTIYNISKMTTMNVSSSTFNDTQASGVGADGFEMSTFGTSNTTLDVSNCTFLRNKTNAIQYIGADNSISSVDMTGNTMNHVNNVLGGGTIDLDAEDNADVDFNLSNNPLMRGALTITLNVYAQDNSTMEGRINNNNIATVAGSGDGIRVLAQDESDIKVEINANTISNILDNGINLISRDGTGRLDAIVSNNNITSGNAGNTANAHIRSAAGASSSVHSNKTCAWVKNNTVVGTTSFAHHEGRLVGAHELILQGGGASMAANWNNNANSPASPPAVMNPLISGAGMINFAGTCMAPTNPLP